MAIKGELFSTDMVRAFLENRKSRTSRPIKPQPDRHFETNEKPFYLYDVEFNKGIINPKYQPGDTMYVRETWYYESHMEDMTAGEPDLPSGAYSHRYIFKADNPDYPVNVGVGQHGWRPSIHMPCEAARLFFRVTDVKVQNIADMTEQDAKQDGFEDLSHVFEEDKNYTALSHFKSFWADTYGIESSWMWVYYLQPISKEEALKV